MTTDLKKLCAEEEAAYALQCEFHNWRRSMRMDPPDWHARMLLRWAFAAGFGCGMVLPLERRDIG